MLPLGIIRIPGYGENHLRDESYIPQTSLFQTSSEQLKRRHISCLSIFGRLLNADKALLRRAAKHMKLYLSTPALPVPEQVLLSEEDLLMITPLGDRIVVKPDKSREMTVSGIVLPDTAREKPQEGEVVAIGKGLLLESGQRGSMEIKVGDRVIFAEYSETEVNVDGETYLIMRESDVLAIR